MTDRQEGEDTPQVEHRARELLDGGNEGRAPVSEEAGSARRAAERILEDSEARIADPAARDIADDSVVRRSSEETASG